MVARDLACRFVSRPTHTYTHDRTMSRRSGTRWNAAGGSNEINKNWNADGRLGRTPPERLARPRLAADLLPTDDGGPRQQPEEAARAIAPTAAALFAATRWRLDLEEAEATAELLRRLGRLPQPSAWMYDRMALEDGVAPRPGEDTARFWEQYAAIASNPPKASTHSTPAPDPA